MGCNSIHSYGGDGLEIVDGYTGTLDATQNWWGSATGPTIASNPGGTGETIVDPNNQVVYAPFLTSGADGNPSAPGFQCGCPLTCPANVSVSNAPNQCGATVTYPAPTAGPSCGTVTCAPISGSFFPVGTTTVTCTPTTGSACTFTVQVTDTQAPTITCPTSVTSVTPAPNQMGTIVTYPPPTASDNCPGVTVTCVPASGSIFPVGTTTVTCTATDASGNTATCSFTVTEFDVCLQDDSNPATVLLFNSFTGAYRFCCAGTTYVGTGTVTKGGGTITLQHNPPDRRVMGKVNTGTNSGTASLQAPPGSPKCSIIDRDIRNNSCVCAAPAP
jgi:hypothetical protein